MATVVDDFVSPLHGAWQQLIRNGLPLLRELIGEWPLFLLLDLRTLSRGHRNLADEVAPIWVDVLEINLEDTEACQIMRMLIFCVHTLKIRVKKLTLIAGRVDCTMVNLVRMFSTSLEEMKLIDCMEWSKTGVHGLAKLPKLEAVHVASNGCFHGPGRDVTARPLDPGALECISGFHQLRSFKSSCTQDLTDESVKRFLSKCLQLEKIEFIFSTQQWSQHRLTDAAFEHVEQLTKLKEAKLRHLDGLTARTLENVSKCKNLTSIDLAFCSDILDCADLLRLPNLQKVDLSGYAGDADVAAEHLSKLPELTHVRLRNCETLTDAGIEHFGKCAKLQEADFSDCRGLTDAAPRFLVHCAQLQSVDFRQSEEPLDWDNYG